MKFAGRVNDCYVGLTAFDCYAILQCEEDQTLLNDIYGPLWTHRHPLILLFRDNH